MRIDDLEKERRNTKRNAGTGNYMGFSASEQTKDNISEWVVGNDLPTDEKTLKNLHCTLIYSKGKDMPDGLAREGDIEPITIEPDNIQFSIFPTQDDSACLVIELKSPEIIDRNKQLTEENGATSDFPTYKPHMTVCYGIDRDFDTTTLNPVTFPIVFDFEYQEPIDDKS